MPQTTPTNPTLIPPIDGAGVPIGGEVSVTPPVAPANPSGSESPKLGSTVSPGANRRARKGPLSERIEAFVSRLSSKNNFWHRVTSLIWLPYAFRSGIKMKRIDGKTFEAVLPFRRFNRNWYNAMAGAALLGNAEIAGGMYVFGTCGGDYTVVCKHLEYKFLRPCFGPARYLITPLEDVHALVGQGGEFNITIKMDVQQQLNKPGDKPKRVGRATATFHVTPKSHHKHKKAARAGK